MIKNDKVVTEDDDLMEVVMNGINTILNLLGEDAVKEFTLVAVAFLECKIKESETKIDDMLFLPTLERIRKVLGE
jgi:hypothetical protein